jgi:hypothetical protein
MSSPFGSAVGGFFSVGGGGACPSWVWVIPWLNATINVDVFCLPWALAAYAVMKAALLVLAAFFSFRIAVE